MLVPSIASAFTARRDTGHSSADPASIGAAQGPVWPAFICSTRT
jgi:hypothetical protein